MGLFGLQMQDSERDSVNNGIIYQPQLVSRISEPSTVSSDDGQKTAVKNGTTFFRFYFSLELLRRARMTKGICRLRNTKQDTPVRHQEDTGETTWHESKTCCTIKGSLFLHHLGCTKKPLVNNGINGSTTNLVPGEFTGFFPSTLVSLKHYIIILTFSVESSRQSLKIQSITSWEWYWNLKTMPMRFGADGTP